MSTVYLVLPLLGFVLLGALMSWNHTKVNLQISVLASTAILVIGTLTTLPLLAHLVFGGVLELPVVGSFFHDLVHPQGAHVSADPVVSLLAGIWMMVAVVRVIGLARRYRSGRDAHAVPLATIDTPEPFAYVMPGGSNTIVLSSGLLDRLSRSEIDVVVAHEAAHARFRHDRLLFVGYVATATLPLLYPIRRWLEFSLERVADESAVMSCGDRRLVAKTLAKVALARYPEPLAPGIARMGIAARVRHLSADTSRVSVLISSMTLLGMAPLALLALLQWHHVVLAVRHVCGW
jgi:Zn-dependent protease with chaperone function